MTSTETKLISINAALAERAERLRMIPVSAIDGYGPGCNAARSDYHALKAQIRDLETEKHALLQELAL